MNNEKILAVIPARGGSKGLPRKNIRPIAGKPLIAWTIEEAKKSRFIDRIILSSEDDEIITVAKNYGCDVPFKRSADLAKDNTPGIFPILDAIKRLPDYDAVILLQPTSPLRTVSDIDECIESYYQEKVNSIVSVTTPTKSPYWMYSINKQNKLKPILNTENTMMIRQDLPSAFVLNGAIYMTNCRWLLETQTFMTPETCAFLMPPERSIDIDTLLDFDMAGLLLEKRNTK